MATTSTAARPARAIPLTFAAMPGGRFPPVLTGDHARVTAPAGGDPMWVVHRYADLLSVKSSRAWRMANRCETPLTGAEIPGGDPPGHMLGMDGATHRRLRHTIGHLFTSEAADALRPQMRRTATRLLDRIARRGTGDLRADYAEPATAATVCAALGVPVADWAPVIRPAGEIAFGVVRPGGGLAGARAGWDGIWDYYARVITAKRARLDGGLVAQMFLAMTHAGYQAEHIVRAIATVSNGATAMMPVLERVLLWLLEHPGARARHGQRTWAQAVREAIAAGALFPVTPPLVAGKGARIGPHPVPEGTLVLPSLASAVRHSRAGAWLAFGPGPHRCPGDELTLAALEEFTDAFFRLQPGVSLTTTTLAWRDGPLATPREARFAVRLPRAALRPAALTAQKIAWLNLSIRFLAALPITIPVTSATRPVVITGNSTASLASFRLLLSLRAGGSGGIRRDDVSGLTGASDTGEASSLLSGRSLQVDRARRAGSCRHPSGGTFRAASGGLAGAVRGGPAGPGRSSPGWPQGFGHHWHPHMRRRPGRVARPAPAAAFPHRRPAGAERGGQPVGFD